MSADGNIIRGLIVTALIAIVATVGVVFAPTASADYIGVRLTDGDRPICVSTHNTPNRRLKRNLIAAAREWKERTTLNVILRYNCNRAGYAQRINVVQGSWGGVWSGRTRYGDKDWRRVDTGGPWTKNGWTYTTSTVRVMIDMDLVGGYSNHSQRHVLSHELAHAFGLDHVTHTCGSVLTRKCSSFKYTYSTWWDQVGTVEHPGINQLYREG